MRKYDQGGFGVTIGHFFNINPASNFQIHYKSGLAGFCRKPDPANFSVPPQEN
jgi:hypothetical protein